jgi:hypothetical protein
MAGCGQVVVRGKAKAPLAVSDRLRVTRLSLSVDG